MTVYGRVFFIAYNIVRLCFDDLGVYDARMRTLIKFLSLMFGILWEDVEDLEDQTQGRFQEEGHEPTE